MSMPPPPGTPPPPPPGYPPAPPPGTPPPGYFPPGAPGVAGAPSPQADGLPLAGFGVRLGAFLLDSLLYGLVTVPFIVIGAIMWVTSLDCVTIGNTTECELRDGGAGPIVLGTFVMVAGAFLAFALFVRALARTGQPWGARIVGVRVVRTGSGEIIGLGRAIGRTLFQYFLSGSICYLGYLWMLWDPKKQTWHDKVSDSVVVRVPGS